MSASQLIRLVAEIYPVLAFAFVQQHATRLADVENAARADATLSIILRTCIAGLACAFMGTAIVALMLQAISVFAFICALAVGILFTAQISRSVSAINSIAADAKDVMLLSLGVSLLPVSVHTLCMTLTRTPSSPPIRRPSVPVPTAVRSFREIPPPEFRTVFPFHFLFGPTINEDAHWARALAENAVSETGNEPRVHTHDATECDAISGEAFAHGDTAFILDDCRTTPVSLLTLQNLFIPNTPSTDSASASASASLPSRSYSGKNPFTNTLVLSIEKVVISFSNM